MGETADEEIFLIETSPLISVLKIERFDLYGAIPLRPACTEHVRCEVIDPMHKERCDKLFLGGHLNELSLTDPKHHVQMSELSDRGFGRGESSSIVLAQHRGLTLVMDDKRAIKVATKLKIRILSTVDVVSENIRAGTISVKEADLLIEAWKDAKDYPCSISSFRELFP